MMEHASLFLIPFISAAIGWITNWVAIKMLFRPRQERNYYFFKLHGIFPKRKKLLAERLGKIVGTELFSMDMIVAKVDTEENREHLKQAILSEVETFVRAKIKGANPLIALFATEGMITQLLQKVKDMLDESIPRMIAQLTNKLEEIDIEKVVYNRVMNFSDEKFENLLMAVIKKELGFIEISGAVLGFIVGVFQSLIVWGFRL